MKSFPCNKCGACCKSVSLSQETQFLDRGDGMCRHLNMLNNKCSIYEDRPDICRVDVQYHKHYKEHYGWEDFVHLNLTSCQILMKNID